MSGDVQDITFHRVLPGYWVVQVGGVSRPVRAIRSGRNWHVYRDELDYSKPGSREEYLGSTRNLRDAKSLMVAAWLHMDTARELAHYEALAVELERLQALARTLQITYPRQVSAEFKLEAHVEYVRGLIKSRLRAKGIPEGRSNIL